ncbi:MAG: hypothetical protein WC935_07030, partial [Thermoleophilia bacterium]
ARPGGCHDTILCVNCATKHGLWCERHREPHMGIGGTTHHVCGKCLAEGIAAIADIDVLQRWLDALPRDGYVILERTCRTAAELHLCANDPAHWARWILVVAALQNGEATHDRLLALEKEVEETHNLMLLMPTWAIEQYEQADG